MKRIVPLLLTLLGACSQVNEDPALTPLATFTVSNLNDSGRGSLRQAILDANALPGPDSIGFSVGGTITLASTLPDITDDLTITGNIFPNAVTISGNNAVSVFSIDSGVVNLYNLTITGGHARDYYAGGGILHDGGDLYISDSTISGNRAQAGGGIYSNNGTLDIRNTTISDNTAEYGGGVSSHSTLTVIDSTISGNSAYSGDASDDAWGGGIYTYGPVTLSNSTIAGNSAQYGGGLYNDSSGTLTITNSTIARNAASAGGGGIHIYWKPDPPFTFTLNNSIVALNSAPSSPDLSGFPVTGGSNNLIGGDPGLDPTGLQDNGGFTNTIALMRGSPAIDAANAESCPATDQRGVIRPQGNGCDVGAYEVEYRLDRSVLGLDFWKANFAETGVFLPLMLGNFGINDVSTVRGVFAETNCGKKHNDAVGCLAGHLLVAKLNVANGSDGCIAHTIREADAPLVSIGYNGPSGSYTLTKAQRRTAISLKNTLDSYNNGLGCPQFSD